MALFNCVTLTASVLPAPAATPVTRLVPAVPEMSTSAPLVEAPTVSVRLIGFCCRRPIVPLVMLVCRLVMLVLFVASEASTAFRAPPTLV